jgi:hypothetical protein
MCDRSCRITKLAGQSLCSLFLCCVPDSHKGDRPATERELESTPDTHPSVSADLPPDVGGKGCGYRKHIRPRRQIGGVYGMCTALYTRRLGERTMKRRASGGSLSNDDVAPGLHLPEWPPPRSLA